MKPDDETNELVMALAAGIRDAGHQIDSPITVLGSSARADGGSEVQFSATRLIPLELDDASLSDAYLALPVTGQASLAPDGSAQEVSLPPSTGEEEAQARAWARNLFATGAVDGFARTAPSFGPPQRPTHALVPDEDGRRVLRRIGFVAA